MGQAGDLLRRYGVLAAIMAVAYVWVYLNVEWMSVLELLGFFVVSLVSLVIQKGMFDNFRANRNGGE